MKRAIIATLILSFFLNSCSKNKISKNDLTAYNLFGNVQSMKESRFGVAEKFGEIVKLPNDKKPTVDIIFNINGQIIELYGYNSDGSLNVKMIFKYNEKGNNIESADYEADGTLSLKSTNKYDDMGNIIESNVYNPDSLMQKVIYKYDKNGNKIEENSYEPGGKLSLKTLNKYDHKGIIIESKKLDYKEVIYIKDEDGNFKKDKNGNIVFTTQFNSIATSGNTMSYKYDKNGNQIELIGYDSDGSIGFSNTYKYDDMGNCVERNGFLWGEYESNKYEYEYDSHKNWIKSIYSFNGTPVHIEEREIQYFK